MVINGTPINMFFQIFPTTAPTCGSLSRHLFKSPRYMTPRICSNSPKNPTKYGPCWKIHGFLGFPCENPQSVGEAFAACIATYPIHKASGVTKKTVQLIGTPGGRPTAKRDTGHGLKQQDIESLRDETNCWGIPNGVHLHQNCDTEQSKTWGSNCQMFVSFSPRLSNIPTSWLS